eukprot:scaffold41479_cov43-Attheya_sp.AAC.2
MATQATLLATLALLLASNFVNSFQLAFSLGQHHAPTSRRLIIARMQESLATDSMTRKNNKISFPPQRVELIEPTTNVKVVLIGTMHYNPTSIRMVEDTIDGFGRSGTLGSVLIESCDVRWNETSALLETPQGKLLKPVLTSEMKAATVRAMEYGRPVVLGDQRINITTASIGQAFKQTGMDLISPLGGGWQRFSKDLKDAAAVALPSGPGYLGPSSFFDARLLMAAPVSFLKYPLAFLARSPVPTLIVFSGLFSLNFLDQTLVELSAASDAVTLQDQITSWVASILFSGLEFALFGRVLLQVLLAERNEVIAQNILDQCKLYSKKDIIKNDAGIQIPFLGDLADNLFGVNAGGKQSITEVFPDGEMMYVPGSLEKANIMDSSESEKVVVAVLGMAHCNGIIKLLKENNFQSKI